MINILFVDDEPNILGGLERMLRTMRREWQMSFAEGGKEALSIIGEKDIDIVVSDMKMPGMDGSQFLQKISSQYPQIIRIILSGYSEKETVMKSVGVAHQYLSKPCDSAVLKETVNRACALRNLLTDEKLRHLVSQLPFVPTLPKLYQKLINELNSQDPQMGKISEIIQQDMEMTKKILETTNSPFFGSKRNITDADEAIGFLGIHTVKALTLGIGVFSQFESSELPGSFLSGIWNHSLAVGTMARTIAKGQNPEAAAEAFTAGLLHEVGKIILILNLPEKFAASQLLIENEKMESAAAERQIFKTTHSEIAAYLLGLWGLPTQVAEAVAFHRNPGEFQSDTFTPLTAVHIADALHHHQAKSICQSSEKHLDAKYLARLGLSGEIPVWQEKYANQF